MSGAEEETPPDEEEMPTRRGRDANQTRKRCQPDEEEMPPDEEEMPPDEEEMPASKETAGGEYW